MKRTAVARVPEDHRLRPGHIITVDTSGSGTGVSKVIVRRSAGSTDPAPSAAFQRKFGLSLSATVLKATRAALVQFSRGAGGVYMGTNMAVAGAAAAAYGTAVRALGYGAAAGALAAGIGGGAAIWLGVVAEAHGGTAAADYPVLSEALRWVVEATGAAAFGKIVLMGTQDAALKFADTVLRSPEPGAKTALGEIRDGLRGMGRGLRDGASGLASGLGASGAPGLGVGARCA